MVIHIDVAPQDLRILRVYDIKHIDAGDVKKKLSELELIGKKSPADPTAARLVTIIPEYGIGYES